MPSAYCVLPSRFSFFAARFSLRVFCGGFFLSFLTSSVFAISHLVHGVGPARLRRVHRCVGYTPAPGKSNPRAPRGGEGRACAIPLLSPPTEIEQHVSGERGPSDRAVVVPHAG